MAQSISKGAALPRRIMIVGSAGAGKSWLARQLGLRLGLPVVHLDALYWRPGWVAPPAEEFLAAVTQAAGYEAWIIDGNYSDTMAPRLARAGMVIFLDLPRRTCMLRILKRSILERGGARPDSAPGCPERFDPGFLKWVWDYPTLRRPKMLRILEQLPSSIRVVRLRSSREIERFIRSGEDPVT